MNSAIRYPPHSNFSKITLNICLIFIILLQYFEITMIERRVIRLARLLKSCSNCRENRGFSPSLSYVIM